MTKKFGPWIEYDKAWNNYKKPKNLSDDQIIEAAFINNKGVLIADSYERPAGHHVWEGTLAYRVEQVETTEVVYGPLGGGWRIERFPYHTHKITYTVDQDGNALSCKMEKL